MKFFRGDAEEASGANPGTYKIHFALGHLERCSLLCILQSWEDRYKVNYEEPKNRNYEISNNNSEVISYIHKDFQDTSLFMFRLIIKFIVFLK